MSAPDLDAIRARAEAATEGPWGSATTDSGFAVHRGAHYTVALYLSRLDAEFIAHAREDVPALLDEVERLRDDRDKQGRFLSTVDEFARVSAMSHDAVLEAVGVRADLDRAEATIARVQKALTNHPHCDRHAGDDPITCGWKRAVLDVQAAIEGTDS